MTDVFAGLPEEQGKLLRRTRQPRSVEPMKAVLTDERFSDPAWIFERKLDGIRCVAFRDGETVRLVSRTGKSQNSDFPELVEAIGGELCDDFVVDGEVVAFRDGVTSFARLQQRHRQRVPLFLYVFDVLHLAGHDVTRIPLRSRKSLLRRALEFHGGVRFTPHRNRDGEAFYEEACARGLEGLIAKRADSPYLQKRSGDWLKLKCSAEQELVIGGFTAPRGSRTDFGALLVGHYEDGELRYAGKVGTGFDRDTLHRLGRRLRDLERDSSPFDEVKPLPAGTHWVEPELVAQVAFTEWTRDGRLRHPRFLGLRDDKAARDVVRERPAG
jgi:bifunctional non-homologous end joining protein LigD